VKSFYWGVCLLIFCPRTWGFVSLEFLAKVHLPSQFEFKQTRVGGLSGLIYDPDKKMWVAVCDDRGKYGHPRFYEFEISVTQKKLVTTLKVTPKDVIFLHKKGEAFWAKAGVGLKAITILPWGNYLVASDGDYNVKPRVAPTLMDIKVDGTWARDFELPEETRPNKLGRVTKGILNNQGPEGLTSTDDGRYTFVAIESPLAQDHGEQLGQTRLYQYEMPEAWIIRPTKTFFYPLDPASAGVSLSERGVSEILSTGGRDLLVLERAFESSDEGLGYTVKIFQVSVPLTEGKVLSKDLVFHFKSQGHSANYEGMAWGPTLPDGRKTLIVLSNNNFKDSIPTEFALFAVKDGPSPVPSPLVPLSKEKK